MAFLRAAWRTAGSMLVVAGLQACGSDGSEEARLAFENSSPAAVLPSGHPTDAKVPQDHPGTASSSSVAGVAWTVPQGWEEQGARAMRAASYTIRTNREGTAECAVFYFGTGQGGGIQANIDRWIHQFAQTDGSISTERAHTSHAEKSGWSLTTVDVSGSYTGGMGPASQSQEPQPGYRMLAAIIEGPEGPVFFKLTGPEAVVQASVSDFNTLLDSLRPAS